MKMVEVKTAELIGPALDWAVAKVEGVSVRVLSANNPGELWQVQKQWRGDGPYWPSQDWLQGGSLISKHVVEISAGDIWQEDGGGTWSAITITDRADAEHSVAYAYGDTPLHAICRVIVVANIGDVVSVPAELVTGQKPVDAGRS